MNDRVTLDATTVARMVGRQFPHWSHHRVRPVAQGGWDNLTFHLGDGMKVRLPSAERYVAQVQKENDVLPRLAPHLPLAVPVPLGIGQPDEDFAWPWSIYGWIDGETVAADRIAGMPRFARDLAKFLVNLQDVDTKGGPAAGTQNFHRGGNLAVCADEVASCIELLGPQIDQRRAKRVWDMALNNRWENAPVWVHGDIAVGNLLVQHGRLSAVIDFGGCGIGDPACDLVINWTFLDDDGRTAFRQALAPDAGTWARARGWALWKALLMATRDQKVHHAETPPLEVARLVMADAFAEI